MKFGVTRHNISSFNMVISGFWLRISLLWNAPANVRYGVKGVPVCEQRRLEEVIPRAIASTSDMLKFQQLNIPFIGVYFLTEMMMKLRYSC